MKSKIYKCLVVLLALFSVNWVQAQVNHLVISQVYGGGGLTNATYKNDFIEIFNPTGSSVNVSGYSVQYAGTAGSTWSKTNLTGSIPAGGYYLVQEFSTASIGSSLPTPDVTGTIDLAGANGKVTLVSNQTTITAGTSCPTGVVDFVGYGTANCFEGTAAVSALSSTLSGKRNSNGCIDTDNNSANFTAGTPAARNSASPAVYCYPTQLAISTISPASPIAGNGFSVTVQAKDAGGNLNNVIANTTFTLSNTNGGTIGGTTTGMIAAGTNSVVVTGVTLSASAPNVTLTATRIAGDNLSAGTSSTFTVVPSGGTPTKFVITSITPTSPTAGIGFDIVVQSQDGSNIAQNVSANTSFSLSTNGNAGTIGGTTTGTIPAGANTFTVTGVTLSSGGSGVTLTAMGTAGDNLTAGTSSAFTVLAPTKFAITSISPSTPIAGSGFNVTVVAQDNGNTAQNVASNTSFSLSTNGNAGTIGGTTTGTITAGSNSVTVTGVTLSTGGTGVTLTATRSSGDNLTAGTSTTFTVLGVADHLTFVNVPTTGASSTPLSTFTVQARRFDNTVDVNYTGNITITKASGPGTLSGTATVAAVAGVATFNTLVFDQAGTYTLNAGSGSLTNDVSGSIAISQSPITWNFASASPSGGTPVANLTVSAISQVNNNGSTTLLTSTSTSDYTNASAGNNAGAATINGGFNSGTSTAFQFTLTPASGYNVTLSGFSFGTRSTGSGPLAYSLRSSNDNYATDIATGSMLNNSVWVMKTATMSAVPSNSGSAITFRLYGYNGSGGTGGTANWRIDDVTLTYSVQLCANPTTFTVTGTGTYCSNPGTGLAVGLSGSESGYSYQLKNGSTNAGSPVTGTGNAISFGTFTTGTYTVLATNPSGGCSANMVGAATVALVASPTVTVSSQTNVSCNGGSDGAATVNATGGTGFVYSWSPSGGTTATASNLSAGNYTCTVTNSGGCVSTATVAITQPTALTHSVSSQTNISCNGLNNGSATVSVNGGTPAYAYNWSPTGGTTATASNLAPGTYTCTITDSHGCTGTETVTITEPTAITHSISSQTNVSCNGGNDGSATVSASGGTGTLHYSWSPGGGQAATKSSLTAGTYTCTITDDNGCVVTETVTITEPSAITHSISSSANVSCNSGSDGSATVMVSGGTPSYVYNWSPSGGQAAAASGLSAGNYTCTITDANGCTATQTVAITQPTALSVDAGNNTAICVGASAALTASSIGGTGAVIYLWTPGNMTTTTVTVSPTSSTTYTLTGTDANGCTNMATVMVTVNNLPTVSASANPTTVCDGDPSTLTATGAATYSWNTGSNGASVQVAPNANTTYTVTGTDANGCVNTGTVAVSVITCTGAAAEALSFDGTNDYISGTNSSLPQGIAARTITAWIKPAQVQTTQTIFSYGGANANESSTISINGGNLYYSSGSNDVSGTSVCAIAPNVWTHVAVTLTNKTVKFYINGTLKFTGTLTTAPATTGTNWTISSATAPFEGWMDEVSVWNSVLTTQIPGTMNQEIAAGQTGNIALYHFNQGFAGGTNTTTNTLTDASSTSSTGTLNSFALSGTSSNWVAPGRAGKTKLKDVYCGITVSDMNMQFFAEQINNATNYQWEFTDLSNSVVYTFTRGNNQNNFYFYMLPQITYGKTYAVRVKGLIGGVWGSYGEECQIITPTAPTTSLQSVCGTTIPSRYTQLFITAVQGASNYEYEFTDVNTSAVFTKLRGNNQINFYLYMAPLAQVNKTYDVRVRPIFGSTPGSYGSVCTITTPPTMARLAGDPVAPEEELTTGKNTIAADEPVWNFVVYPNPGVGTFYLESNAENAQVEVFDALGQLVYKEQITTTVHTIKLDESRKGMFYLRVMSNNKMLYTTKLVNQ